MSYEAAKSVREFFELEMIKGMSPEELNATFNKLNERITKLESLLNEVLNDNGYAGHTTSETLNKIDAFLDKAEPPQPEGK